MNIKVLKNKIKTKQPILLPIVFIYEDTDFIPCQYTDAVADILDMKKTTVDSLDDLPSSNVNYFTGIKSLFVYKCDYLEKIASNDTIIIITKKLSKDAEKYYKDNIVKVDKLENWQIIEYIKAECNGLHERFANWFVDTYGSNIYRINNEISKLKIFPKADQNFMFEEFYRSGAFDIPTEDAILRLAPAIQKKDKKTILDILLHQHVEKEPFAVIGFLQPSFKNLVKVWLTREPTESNTGLKAKQIIAINKLPRIFEKEHLLQIFEMLSGLDNKIRQGLFPSELTLDYVLIKILGA